MVNNSITNFEYWPVNYFTAEVITWCWAHIWGIYFNLFIYLTNYNFHGILNQSDGNEENKCWGEEEKGREPKGAYLSWLIEWILQVD